MDGNSDRSAGLEPADTSGSADHSFWTWRSKVFDAQIAISEAIRILDYSARQEVQAACIILCEARGHLEEACEVAEGQRSG
jgi:hypothetical protein